MVEGFYDLRTGTALFSYCKIVLLSDRDGTATSRALCSAAEPALPDLSGPPHLCQPSSARAAYPRRNPHLDSEYGRNDDRPAYVSEHTRRPPAATPAAKLTRPPRHARAVP